MILTKRDVRVLSLVSRYRLMRSDHLLRLVSGSKQHLIRRLGRLFRAGLLDRPHVQKQLPRAFHSHLVYSLALKGQRELHRGQILTPASLPRFRAQLSALSLSHALRVTDILIAFEASATGLGLRFLPHREWPGFHTASRHQEFRQLRWFVQFRHGGHTRKTNIIPDGAFAIEAPDGQRSYFLLEVDRGTMPATRRSFAQTSFARKIVGYKETRRAGVLWKRFQVPCFRVLVVTESARRLVSLQSATAQWFKGSKSSMILFATAAQVLHAADPFLSVWRACSGEEVPLRSPKHPAPEAGLSTCVDYDRLV